MAKSYNRRTDEEIIGDLQDRIKKIETRLVARERKDSPVLKELPKVKRMLARFAQTCVDHQRGDLSNTVLALLATVERQARQTPDHLNGARVREKEEAV